MDNSFQTKNPLKFQRIFVVVRPINFFISCHLDRARASGEIFPSKYILARKDFSTPLSRANSFALVEMKIYYNQKLQEKARWLRTNMTPPEVKFYQHLKGKQLLGYDFHRQKPILNYIVDFYCPKLKLIIEIDGLVHDFKMEYDDKRQKELEEYRLSLLRFQAWEINKDIDNIIQRIVDWIN